MVVNDYINICKVLITNGKLTQEQLEEALKEQEALKKEARVKGDMSNLVLKITDIVLKLKFVTPKEMAMAIAEYFKLPYYEKSDFGINDYDKNIVRMFRENFASQIKAIPLRKDAGGRYFVAVVDPGDTTVKMRLQATLKVQASTIDFNVVSIDTFNSMFSKIYTLGMSIDNIRKEKEADVRRGFETEIGADNNDISNVVDTILQGAVKERASDIHIESINNEVVVRYRIDTVPVIKDQYPVEIESMIVQKFYILCNLGLDKKLTPQDGRFEKIINGKRYDFRVSFLPSYLPNRKTSKISIRILNAEKVAADIREIGFSDRTLNEFSRLISEPHGLILVVGPMGSGKSSTLFSGISHLNPKEKVIITLEDPPEFSIDYVTQCKIDNSQGFTYESGLKSILRQDADVILVGEIRDTEVGKLAVQAAEIGRLVLSTLHVDNAVSSVLRLNNLGISPFFVSSVLVGVVSQRLVRKICPHCARIHTPSIKDLENASALLGRDLSAQTFKKGVGCDKCGGIGYHGLVPVHEVLNFKEITPLKEAVAQNELKTEVLTSIAVDNGYRPMIFDGYEKVIAGLTTFDEINRIILDINGRKIIDKAKSKSLNRQDK